LADDDDFDSIPTQLIVDISGGIKQIKINEKTVDLVNFKKALSKFLTTNKDTESLLVAGSFDHATLDNIVVFSRIFNQCKSLFDPNNKSKIYFKSFNETTFSKVKTGNTSGE
jgi:hypothetical protein